SGSWVGRSVLARARSVGIGDDGFEMGDTEEETIGDVRIGMRNFVDSAFGLHGDAVIDDDSLGIEFDEPYVPEPDLEKRTS
ncbi:hypothetical protein IFM89_022818, partial [Coptis chinensis]